MTGAISILSHRLRPLVAAICLGAASVLVSASPAAARGPEGIADVAEKVIDAVVNISTSQTVEAKAAQRRRDPATAAGLAVRGVLRRVLQEPPRPGGPKGGEQNGELRPRKTNSLGSGFIIDTSGIVVTNNHVIADADEINVIMNDGTKLKAELVGVDKKTDLAVLEIQSGEAAEGGEVRRFRQAAARRMGDRDRQSVQPRRHASPPASSRRATATSIRPL